jgi:hypothetical protein
MKSLKICGTLMLGALMLGTGCAQTPTMSASGFGSSLLKGSTIQANVIVDQEVSNSEDVETKQVNVKNGARKGSSYSRKSSRSHGSSLIDDSTIQANVIVDQEISNSEDVETKQVNVINRNSDSKKKKYGRR